PPLLALALDRAVKLTIVGPESALECGIVDRFREAGVPIFGPTKAAAEIETSKSFAKRLMTDAGVPTALAEMHTTVAGARAAVTRFGAPVVVKASGLAAGKGVIVCDTIAEAHSAIADMLEGNRFGTAGAEVLVEEFMEGEEVSMFAITDGHRFVLLPGLQDHKRLLDGDGGPNTGGMGAYTPVSLEFSSAALEVITPVLAAMVAAGRPFTGLLYAGLMLTAHGIRVVEFNCRFGDPETQALMPVLELRPSLLELMRRVATGEGLGDVATFAVESQACVTTVLAAAGYPDAPRSGDAIAIPATESGEFVFHAGTARDGTGRLVTAGGRVLTVSAVGRDLAEAQRRSRALAERVQFDGKQHRTDIGAREIARSVARPSAGAPRD
ncbi:MAG: phosphoribosylamine--glycine ligase, partial [Gemmatimonadaceae bacterium]|nr:phosphoribosylamine--glycine ligase [Gemmatimonadaceae bacterium]